MGNRRSGYPNRAILAAAAVLVTYLLLLIGTAYVGQTWLQRAVTQQLRLNVEKQAVALGYFFAERKEDVATLASDSTAATYFANKALGMSMEYGLRASLLGMRERFLELASRKRLGGQAIFRRITFYGEDLQALVDTRLVDAEHLLWADPFPWRYDQIEISVSSGDDGLAAYVAGPVIYKEEVVGLIVAEIDLEFVSSTLAAGILHSDADRVILFAPEGSFDLRASDDADFGITPEIADDREDSPEARAGPVFLKVKVPGTDFELAGIFDLSATHGVLVSPWLLAALSLLSIPVLLGVRYLLKLNDNNLILHAQFEASRRRRKELRAQNERLEAEINKRVEFQKKLAYQANFDSLTDLPNRYLALDRLSESIKRARRDDAHVLLIYVDLDHFKRVNDTLGHAAGDKLLVKAAQRLRDAMRESDTVARLGGDEFLVICSDMDSAPSRLSDYGDRGEASGKMDRLPTAAVDHSKIGQPLSTQHLAETVLRVFKEPFRIEKHEFYVSTSLGISMFPEHGDSPEQLLRNADIAMYQAKDAGRTGFCFYDRAMDERTNRRVVLERHLRHAVNKGELHLVYQPIFDLQDERIVGAEALLRWESEVLGPVQPDHFIPLAEETGLIRELGEWVLSQGCAEAAGWRSEQPVRLAVNFSPVQFQSPKRLLAVLDRVLKDSGLAPNRLELEITERILLQDHPDIPGVLETLAGMNIRISIDDFGTGYSALNYLRRFSFDVLKIDRSFVRDLLDKEESAEVVRAILAMAEALRLDVIAEGVETEQQAEFLRGHGCRMAQGFYFSKPLPAKDVRNLIQRNSSKRRSPLSG